MFAEVPTYPTIKEVGKPSNTFTLSADDCIAVLEHELLTLHVKKPAFNGVQVPCAPYGSKFRSSIDNTHHSSWQSATSHQGSIIAATTAPSPRSDKFSESFEELINDQGEIALVVDFDP